MKDWRTGISVIIPTYNRSQLLRLTLQSLEKQTLDITLFEIIIVDDGSSDDTREVVKSFSDTLSIKYYFQQDEGFRVARARNIGILNAQFEHVLFLDSGVIAEPSCLSQHLTRYQRSDVGVLIGLCFGFEELEESNLRKFKHRLSEENIFTDSAFLEQYQDCRAAFLRSHHFSLHQINEPWLIFWTCHASCKTHALYEAGGFDEYFCSWGGEDVELALRLHNLGCKFELITEAKAVHYPHPKVKEDTYSSAKENIAYIHNKHCSVATYLLQQGLSWQDILTAHTRPNSALTGTLFHKKSSPTLSQAI
ncbi:MULTISPECIES: glycosyltransferase [Pseudoalteromonas]|uniref:glycosyltransferase n=1 Tax=Pseudoalteromonas TaxID=53246 RepID=UPI000FFEEA0F|nr:MULTISPECIES: glycosyltransferase [Pseudoalteromonas]MCG9760944.1 glycosyltransferase [Pseudoalteromonas sp. Isolate6]NKC19086.1 glycosyltransferase [Pseudoalteromonas galatheae]RXE89249.1 hypothetical protein DRB05_00875 [Pseudoalteromonas sp. A757]